MDISKLDKNFAAEKVNEGEGVLFPATDKRFSLYGVFYDEAAEGFLRMPNEVAKKTSDGVFQLNRQTSGGRLRFSTDSSFLRIYVKWNSLDDMNHMPLSGSSSFTLTETIKGQEKFVGILRSEHNSYEGFNAEIRLSAKKEDKVRTYTLWFPLYNDVKSLALEFAEGAFVGNGAEYRKILPVLYYGSSITQGGCASRADHSYSALISKRFNVDFINLGFSGNAKAEEAISEYLASVLCSVFVYDYDHNAPDAEYLAATHERLFLQFRKAQPFTPVVFLSRPDYKEEDDSLTRREIVLKTYDHAVKAGDKNVWFVDGKTILGKEGWRECTVDGVHPTDLGFMRMANAVGKVLRNIIGF